VGDREVLEEIYGSRNELGILPDGELRVAVENEKFDEQAFLRASERAVVTILDAFSDRRIDILQKLLMKDLFEVLREKIENMGENILKLVVVSFEEKNIVEKIMRNKSNEVITVKLKIAMRQVNYIEDKDHNVVSGSKSKMRKVLEEWTFVKSQSEKRGVWLLKSLNRCSSV
jgi:predicted lipid-binding transport protein (Tim44 family)